MVIRDADEGDLPGILTIHNEAILTTAAIWIDDVVELEDRRTWFRQRRGRGFPVLVAVEGDEVLGHASFGDFREKEGYRYTAEHSVYVAASARGRGIGRALMLPLIDRARALGKHVLIGGIEAENEASLHLHRRLGFKEVARFDEVGTKFGRWLDLVFVQLMLDNAGPAAPSRAGREWPNL